MTSFVAAQINTLIEDIRLLEALVTAPLGLHSDIRMLRQSVPLPEAADLSQEEAQKRRLGYRNLAGDPVILALQTIGHANSSVSVLESVEGDGDPPLGSEWLARARRVLDRAEQRVAGGLRAATLSRLRGLYVIIDPEATGGREASAVTEATLRGGAAAVQLRYRSPNAVQVLAAAAQIKSLCDKHNALFLVEGDPAVALASDADGLHLGQSDMPVPQARRVLAASQVIGCSNNTLDEVSRSQALGVDYLSIGPIFPTSTKGSADGPAVGVRMVSDVKDTASQPVVAVGGIDARNIAEVVRAGADCAGVGSAVTMTDDPEAAARALVGAIEAARSEGRRRR